MFSAASRTLASRARRRPIAAAGFVLLLVLAFFYAGTSWGGNSAKRPAAKGSVSVIVRTSPGRESATESAVRKLGGRIELQLRIIHGFSAQLPASAVAKVRGLPGVVSVTRDRLLRPQSATYNPVTDVGSMLNVTQMTGAQAYWQAGYTGRGVDVALIDSGVVPVDGLTAAGKVVNGADLSFESQASNLIYLDSFGHGTHMAGIIAGRADAAVPGQYAGDATNFVGMAPDARIISVKVADALGHTDVSQVIAALGWIVQHRTDNGLNIRIVNLSYGTNGSQDYTLDPLAYAAEVAWKKGLVVVTAAGNAGFAKSGSLTDPAYDPAVLAVGAADTQGTTTYADDTVASFSSNSIVGRNKRTVDLLAPGTHIVSLRDPGSFVDQTYGSTGSVTDTLFRGSGTSQAAAIVSGAAALVIQQRPSITPDQLRALLAKGADRLNGVSVQAQGSGELDLRNVLSQKIPNNTQGYLASTGSGPLELSRGDVHLVLDDVTLSGERDIFGAPFASAAMAALEAAGNSWSDGAWNGNSWSGNSWSGNSWSGNSWSGNSWSGNSWSGNSWSSYSWSGNSWSGNSWSGNSWSGNSWSGNSWSGNSWSGGALSVGDTVFDSSTGTTTTSESTGSQSSWSVPLWG
jgi:serine protease AprX